VGTIGILARNQEIRQQIIKDGNVRKIVTSKYRYTITYIPTASKIEIIGIFRYQNRDV